MQLADHLWDSLLPVSTCSSSRHFWVPGSTLRVGHFNILPICRNTPAGEVPTTPYQLFHGTSPSISAFRVFGSPVVVKRRVTEMSSIGKQTERGTRGIFIGFPSNQKGYLIFCLGSRQILVSDDVIFDESFQAAIATTW